ncbi:winged helix-turn-helix domain-containing protein [Oscillochloris sp. ZM17-4]|uniref:winged helix-turn-helix domain-containing protein n=1 Tax=Oscillochloris sp. ZM17-4 TaxID=2866714 RepID=UPI001C72DD5E|nr:winged helix-turn-helix domain-containing protein [Oscillochloris sp. ZM17-4]
MSSSDDWQSPPCSWPCWPPPRPPRFNNKVGWARTHLGKAKLAESLRRGWFRITGIESLIWAQGKTSCTRL